MRGTLCFEFRLVHNASMLPPSLDAAAHVVQLALTPIFLLTGLAQLLNVFSARLGRVADRVDLLTRDTTGHDLQLKRLRLRSRILDVAVVLAALGGGFTCLAAMVLFFGALRNAAAGSILLALFGGALAFSIMALVAFVSETILSGRSIREQAESRSPPIGGLPQKPGAADA